MGTPRLTVLMTLYNKAAFVMDAVRSALGSTFQDLELLVVDDGSTDGGLERIEGVGDPRLRVLAWPHANSGRGAAANRGFNAARGEFIAILDADDVAEPTRFSRQIDFLLSHPEIGAVGSAARAFGDRSVVAHWPPTDEALRSDLLFADPLLYGSAMFRRSILTRSGIRCREDWDRPGMDYLFLLELSRHTRMANLPEVLTNYRIGPNNFLHGRNALDDRVAIYAEAFRILGVPGGEQEARLHVMFEKRFHVRPDLSSVRALYNWMERLRAWNGRERGFPSPGFEARLHQRWMDLFYVFADRWPRLAIEHLRIGGGWSMRRSVYWLRARFTPRTGPAAATTAA